MADNTESFEALSSENRRCGYEGSSVDVEYKGRTHYGRFVVGGKIIRVSYEGQQKSAQLGASRADFLAKIILLELVVRASASQEIDPEKFGWRRR